MFALRRTILSIRSLSSVATSMKNGYIVPDVIDIPPECIVEVIYPCGGVKVRLGNELTPTQVKNIPCVRWKFQKDCFYTLCMTDPDAPSRREPKFREWHHWLVVNIPGCCVKQGETLSEYIGSGPPKDTGLHRYVFLVYKQKGKIRFTEKHLPNDSARCRGGFSIRKFAEKYKLGFPMFGNFFQAQYDEYVPLLYKQLSK